MQTAQPDIAPATASTWLTRYYFTRFAVSALWVLLAFTLAQRSAGLAALLLVLYPAWDALANAVDGRRSGGLVNNPSQAFNTVVSAVTAAAVAFALTWSLNGVLVVFGAWATLSGLLQLATGVRRWRTAGAQWAMILSGAQSAVAGVLFVRMALGSVPVGIATVAPYAAFGAFYFLLSAAWLAIRARRAG